MSDKRHYAVIDKYNRKLTLQYKGEVVAETTEALILKEVGKTVYDPVFYLPKEALKIQLAPDAGHKSHCPIKGDASYWNLPDAFTESYFAWSYENSLPHTKKIEGHIAFNMKYITVVSAPIETTA